MLYGFEALLNNVDKGFCKLYCIFLILRMDTDNN
jgi:hypothetical protein